MVLENASLFVDLHHAVPQLAMHISHYKNRDVLVVVICEDVMPVASQIAGKLMLNLIFSTVDANAKTADSLDKGIPVHFDYDMIRESGRDTPQDFIVHQEQNLRTNLISIYTETYEALSRIYPDKLIILVDQLTNVDAGFFPCLTQTYKDPSVGNSFSSPAIRKFVFLHMSNEKSANSSAQGFDMIIEHTFSK
jgi:hypothetical protein